MSYGHADKLASSGQQPGEQAPPAPVPPAWYARPELQPVLTGHDFAALFRALGAMGISQRQIARLTGRSQPNISEIIHGRQVISYDVLVAITKGLSISPERMGLSWWGPDGKWYGPPDAYPGGDTIATTPKGVTAEMLRRHLIAWGGTVMAGAPVAQVGELLDDLGMPEPVPLPSRLSHTDVAKVRDMTRRLHEAVTTFGSSPEVSTDAAASAMRLLDVPGPEPVTRALRVAVAELHLQAGWSAFDSGLYRRALYHYARALELATEVGDAYCQVLALNWAGLAAIEHGHPNDGLKMLQAARVKSWDIRPDQDRGPVVIGEGSRMALEACGLADSATALAALQEPEPAYRHLGTSRDLWTPTPADPFGDLDRAAARLELARGRLGVAQELAVASVRRWDGGRQKSRTQSGIVLATIHVMAGEQRGLQLAHSVITDVTKLGSVRVRRQLTPLAEALEARPGSDARELARMARQVAA